LNDTIGGGGASASPGGNDEPCVRAGLDKVKGMPRCYMLK
jgi:hypothetical protein